MRNLVDLHSHILPGLDDGAKSLSESLQMLEALEGFGYKFVFATPHHQLYSWEGIKPQVVERRVSEVATAASQKGLGIKILPGMEFDLDETLPDRAAAIPGGTGHILVDAGFLGVFLRTGVLPYATWTGSIPVPANPLGVIQLRSDGKVEIMAMTGIDLKTMAGNINIEAVVGTVNIKGLLTNLNPPVPFLPTTITMDNDEIEGNYLGII